MSTEMKICSSYSCISTTIPFERKGARKLSSRLGLSNSWNFKAASLKSIKVVALCQNRPEKLKASQSSLKRQFILFATSDDDTYSDLEPDIYEQEKEPILEEDVGSSDISLRPVERAAGRPGFISFYGHMHQRKDEVTVDSSQNNQNNLLWLVGPTILVASFVFPSLYLRKILTTVFEDSLLTDFLILFFTEALFYCGVAVFLLLIDRVRRPEVPVYSTVNHNLNPHLGHRIASVTVLVLSLTIPMVTMGFVWPWTGPAASATLAPYLVGIVVQFAFEQYARYINSSSWPAIPIIFQVYRLHQLNRAAQLVTALSFTIRGAEMTTQNVAINGSLSTLLNVLQFLGIICIWSLSSFIVRYFPSITMPDR